MSARSDAGLTVLQAYFDAMAAGGPPAAMPYYSESVVLEVPGRHPASGTYEGHEGVGRFGARMRELTGGTFRLVPVELLAGEQHVVTIADASATVGGVTARWRRVIVSEVEGGTLSRLRFFEEDQNVVDELLGGGADA